MSYRQPFLCRWGFHKWSIWSQPFEKLYGHYQCRSCLRCNIYYEEKCA